MDNLYNPEDDQKDLEAFVVGNPDLERLETLLDQFNMFEAIGAVRQELRHSDFLAFLLNKYDAALTRIGELLDAIPSTVEEDELE